MDPITIIEIIVSVVIVIILFVIALKVPSKLRKSGLIIASSVTVILLSIFSIRPYWIDYHVAIKKELLSDYLKENYPYEKWEIKRQSGRQYSPYHLEVIFKNERGWAYSYSVTNENKICQSAWSPPGEKFPNEGKHYENIHCE